MERAGMQLESNPLTAWMVGQEGRHNIGVLQAAANKAMGLPENVALTPQVMKTARMEAGKLFQEVAEKGNAAMTKEQVRSAILSSVDDSFVNRGKFLKGVDRLLDDFKGDTLNTKSLMSLESSLGDLARKASKTPGTAGQIQSARDAIIEAIPATKGQEVIFKQARDRWAARIAVEESLGPRGAVSAANLAKRVKARGLDSDIGRLGSTAEAMRFMRPTKYGTENAVRGGLTNTILGVAGIGGGAFGLGSLYGK
jgi:hypothetical protein